ncbi:MAG: hypothetical protein ACR2RL_26550 [Gammaproteobacteria bacterium]
MRSSLVPRRVALKLEGYSMDMAYGEFAPSRKCGCFEQIRHPRDNLALVHEQILFNYPSATGTFDYRVRADMTFLTAPNDGAVFSTGAIAFGQSLPFNAFDNDCATVPKKRRRRVCAIRQIAEYGLVD